VQIIIIINFCYKKVLVLTAHDKSSFASKSNNIFESIAEIVASNAFFYFRENAKIMQKWANFGKISRNFVLRKFFVFAKISAMFANIRKEISEKQKFSFQI
jgi:hypothetical protein